MGVYWRARIDYSGTDVMGLLAPWRMRRQPHGAAETPDIPDRGRSGAVKPACQHRCQFLLAINAQPARQVVTCRWQGRA